VKTAEYLCNVRPQWRDAFVRFVETGDAEEDFLNYLNTDSEAQEAVEAAFNAQADAFQAMADEFRKSEDLNRVKSCDPSDIPIEVEVEKVVEDILLLPPTARSEAVHRTASALKATLGPDQQRLLVRGCGR
jgi:hypothetical protein